MIVPPLVMLALMEMVRAASLRDTIAKDIEKARASFGPGKGK